MSYSERPLTMNGTDIKIGQTWANREKPALKIKIIQAGNSFPYKYKHKVRSYIPNVIEKEEWMEDGIILFKYTLIELKDKIDVLLNTP